MNCKNCHTKNTKDSVFCKKCGKKLIKKNYIQKYMKYIILSVIILLISVSLSLLFNYYSNPKEVLKRYYKALISADSGKLYDFYDIETSIFTSKDIFKKLYKNSSDLASNWKTYKILDSKYSLDKKEVTFNVKYSLSNKEEPEYTSIALKKTKTGMFKDSWIIIREYSDIVNDFIIEIPSGSKVTIEGIKIPEKYKNEIDNKDIYTIPLMFKTFYNVEVESSDGIYYEEQIKIPGINNKYVVELKKSSIGDKTKYEFEEKTLSALRIIYDAAIRNISSKELRKSFDVGKLDVSQIQDVYNRLLSTLKSDELFLEMMNITSINLISIKKEEDLNIYIGFDISYDFRVSFDDTKNSSHSTNIVYARYTRYKDEYHLIELEYIPYYFSKIY